MAKRFLILAGLLASAATAQVSTLSSPPGGTITSLTQLPTVNNNTILGNNSGGAATPSALTASAAKSLLSITNTDVSGLGTASTAATGTSGHVIPFLDGTNTYSANQIISGNLNLGNTTSVATATPVTLDLGGTFSNTPGANPKLRFYDDGAGGVYGLGVSSGSYEFSAPSTINYNWFSNGSAVGQLSASGAFNVIGPVTGSNLTSGGFPASVATGTIVGRSTAGTGAASALTVAGGLGFSGTTLTAAGALTPTSVASTGAISGTSIAGTSSILSSGATAGVGYATGAGGAVTQITSRVTGVTNNKACGAITMFSAAGSATWATFVVTDSAVAATDVVVTSVKSATNLYMLSVTGVGSGTFNLSFATTGGTATDAPVINYCVVKGVAA